MKLKTFCSFIEEVSIWYDFRLLTKRKWGFKQNEIIPILILVILYNIVSILVRLFSNTIRHWYSSLFRTKSRHVRHRTNVVTDKVVSSIPPLMGCTGYNFLCSNLIVTSKPVVFSIKTDTLDITKILLNVVLNTNNQ